MRGFYVGVKVKPSLRLAFGVGELTCFTQERINGAQQGVLVALGQLADLVYKSKPTATLTSRARLCEN